MTSEAAILKLVDEIRDAVLTARDEPINEKPVAVYVLRELYDCLWYFSGRLPTSALQSNSRGRVTIAGAPVFPVLPTRGPHPDWAVVRYAQFGDAR